MNPTHASSPKKTTQTALSAFTSTIALAAALTLTSCARFSTHQVENRFENGKVAGSISTKVSSYTLFSSKSQLANFKASQTEKTQGASVGNLAQQGATNTVGLINELAELMRELNKLKSPIP